MGVIIKGIKMPTSCRECPFVMVSMRWEEPYAITCVVTPRREITNTLFRQSWCPLEEVEPIHRNPEDAYRKDGRKE